MWQKPIFDGGLPGGGGTMVSGYRRVNAVNSAFSPVLDGERGKTALTYPAFAIVSFTAATSWLSVNGFGRKSNCWPSGRLFSKASSA